MIKWIKQLDKLEFDEEVARRMDELKSIIALIYFAIVLFDVLIVSDARRLLLDFLIGQRNRKNARKIHSEQSFKNKIHMGYIQPMLKKNKEAFRKYHILYLAIIYSLIPQYIVVCLFHYKFCNCSGRILAYCRETWKIVHVYDVDISFRGDDAVSSIDVKSYCFCSFLCCFPELAGVESDLSILVVVYF